MAQFTAVDTVAEFRGTASRVPIAKRFDALFLGHASTIQVLLLAGLPVLGSVWLLLTPAQLLSREMTWDLLFNLSGAWRVHSGQVPHVDFHDPIGPLGFWLTDVGFSIVGPSPHAILVGQTIFLAFAFVTAVVAALGRLATVPAALFVLYAALLVLMPANVGDQPNAYTFAMSYNRWGWSALSTLCLLLFLPPRRHESSRLELVAGGLLLVAMFYLKITFAAAGLAALAVALMASSHVRAKWRAWVIVLLLVVANALGPHNAAYLADIAQALSGAYQRPPWNQFVYLLANKGEYALYGTGLLLLLWMWRRGEATLQSVFFAMVLLGLGAFVMSQSAQLATIPLGTVIAYLAYDAVSRERQVAGFRAPGAILPLLAILVWPALSVVSAASSVAGYHVAATRERGIVSVEGTNLRGLAVPKADDTSASALATIRLPYQLLSTPLERLPHHQITDERYLQTLMEAASLFTNGHRGRAKIMVVDQVNPMPFILGYPPPRGGNLWLSPDMPPRPAEEVFGDVDVVLIPKYPTYNRATITALAVYQDYLAQTFPVHEQSPSWTILGRDRAAITSGESSER